jgi:hypothetical protein
MSSTVSEQYAAMHSSLSLAVLDASESRKVLILHPKSDACPDQVVKEIILRVGLPFVRLVQRSPNLEVADQAVKVFLKCHVPEKKPSRCFEEAWIWVHDLLIEKMAARDSHNGKFLVVVQTTCSAVLLGVN